MDFFKQIPKIKGKIDIYPEIHYDNVPSVTIIGDPAGLKSLANLLTFLADWDQNESGCPDGEREHIHLNPECKEQLGDHSCQVEICRADAKGTGQLPDFMNNPKTIKARKKK